MQKNLMDLLVGTILGDAHIKRVGLTKAYIKFEQSSKKDEYINYLKEQAKEGGLAITNEELKEYTRLDSRNNSTSKSLYFSSEASEDLRVLADLFLDESNNKIIPSNISDFLNHRSLAFWLMDDGQKVSRGGVTLCTDSYNPSEIQILREALESNFNFKTSIHSKKGKGDALYERIYISKDSLDPQKEFIKPHLHDSMLYKINMNVFKEDIDISENEISDNPLGLFED